MLKKILAVLAVAAVIAGVLVWNSGSMKDRRAWGRFQSELQAENVSKIEFGSNRPMTLTEADRAEVLAILRKAAFDRTNREKAGPTPQAVLSITFKDGKTVNLGMWSMTSFELSPRHIDPESQFLIKSEDLGIWLRNHFTGPTVGAGGLLAPGAFSSAIF